MAEHKGRKAGTPNKDKKSMLDKAEALGVDPFEFLCLVMKGDWKGLGMKEIVKGGVKHGLEVTPVERIEPVISFEARTAAAKELCQYMYSKRSAVKISTDEESGFRVIIEDYTEKKKE